MLHDTLKGVSTSYDCAAIHDDKHKIGLESSANLRHATRIADKKATCNHDLVFLPKNNGQALEVWRDGGKTTATVGDCMECFVRLDNVKARFIVDR